MKKLFRQLFCRGCILLIMLVCAVSITGITSEAATTSTKSVTLSGKLNKVSMKAIVKYKVKKSNGKYSLLSISNVSVSDYCGLPSTGSTNTSLCTIDKSTGKLKTAKIRVIVFDVEARAYSIDNNTVNSVTDDTFLETERFVMDNAMKKILVNKMVTFK